MGFYAPGITVTTVKSGEGVTPLRVHVRSKNRDEGRGPRFEVRGPSRKIKGGLQGRGARDEISGPRFEGRGLSKGKHSKRHNRAEVRGPRSE